MFALFFACFVIYYFCEKNIINLLHCSIIEPIWAFQVALAVKNPLANAGDSRNRGLILGWGRSPGVGNVNPLQYSCPENPIDRGA